MQRRLQPMIIVVMGTTGAGKTTVGRLLAERLGFDFEDADDLHTADSIEKMRRGLPLDDADRAGWLATIDNAMQRWRNDGRNVVFACSLLKRAYRERVHLDPRATPLVYLKADYDTTRRRLKQREDHFADERLLASQFAILEEPEHAIVVDATLAPDAIVAVVTAALAVRLAATAKQP
jgi:gluconokinase